jgi:hypothetical protein
MIGKFVVRSRQLDPGHVAGHALVLGNRANLRTRFAARAFDPAMTSQTFRVEVYGLWIEVMVRVMASKTTDARVIRVIASAARQAVRLETDIGDTGMWLRGDFRPGAMALTAKVRRQFGGKPNQLV